MMIRNAGYGASSTSKIGRQTKGPGSSTRRAEIGHSTHLRDCRAENVGSAAPCAQGLYVLMSTIADLRLRGH